MAAKKEEMKKEGAGEVGPEDGGLLCWRLSRARPQEQELAHPERNKAMSDEAMEEASKIADERDTLRSEVERLRGEVVAACRRNIDDAAIWKGEVEAERRRADEAEAVQQTQEDRAKELIAEAEADRAHAESELERVKTEHRAERAFVERLALVIRNPGCGSCANVSAEAAMLLDASPSPEGWVRREEVGPLLDTMHDVLEALADSGELLTRIGGDAREMAQVQSLDNLKAAAAFDAALEAWATKGGKR